MSIQAFVSRRAAEAFSLVADMMYVANNAPRICRAIFEIVLRRGWSTITDKMLNMCKAFELRLWPAAHPLYQFESVISRSFVQKLERAGVGLDDLYDLDDKEICRVAQNSLAGQLVQECLSSFPHVELTAKLHPITRTVIQVRLQIYTAFKWKVSAINHEFYFLVHMNVSRAESFQWRILTCRRSCFGQQGLIQFVSPIHFFSL